MQKSFIVNTRRFLVSVNMKAVSIIKENKELAATVFFGFSFVLSAYAKNMYEVPMGEIVGPLIFTGVLSVLIYMFFYAILRNKSVSAVLSLIMITALWVFENIFIQFVKQVTKVVSYRMPYDYNHVLLLIFIYLVALLGVGLVVKKLLSKKTTKDILNFILIGAFAYSVIFIVQIGFNFITKKPLFNKVHREIQSVQFSEEDRPDIYYFVFDRYGSEHTLKQYYHYDNTEFIAELEKRGFIFNRDNYSNYQFTPTSLSSTLNMDYLDRYTEGLPPVDSQLIYRDLIGNSAAAKMLQANGYRYYHSGSWWGTSRTAASADHNYDTPFKIRILGHGFTVTEFQDILLEKTALRRLFSADIPILSRIVHYEKKYQRQLFNHQFSAVQSLVETAKTEDVFGFFHILSPHPQYVFDADGSIPTYHPDAGFNDVPEYIKYSNQLTYLNSRITEIIDHILSNSEEEPIIILQADEGPYLFECNEFNNCSWGASETEKWKWKMGVLSAIYEPSSLRERQYDKTPVNIFPYVFNKYFDAGLEYKQRQNFISEKDKPYEFIEVTDLLRLKDKE